MNFTYCPQCGKKDTVKKQDDTNYECSNCQWHFWNNNKASAAVFLLRKDGMFLAAKRGREPAKGKYDPPGGFTDYAENPFDSAKREILEETGLTVTNLKLLTAYPNIYTTDTLPPTSTVDMIFVVTEWQGEPKAADDVAALEWKPLEFINDKEFAPRYPGLLELLKSCI